MNTNSPLGILGGGQLGMFFILAAQRMGFRVHLVDPDPNCPGQRYADEFCSTAYNDPQTINFLSTCQAVTVDQEGIPLETLIHLNELGLPIQPHPEALKILQDRLLEKQFLYQNALPTAPFWHPSHPEPISHFLPGIRKTRRGGYDGKGQHNVLSPQDWSPSDSTYTVLEKRIHIQEEVSVIAARSPHGEIIFLPLSSNEHRLGILHKSYVSQSHPLTKEAYEITATILEKLDYCGVLCVEFFWDDQNQLLVNEIAPRPHNSGHYSQDALSLSQYDYQVRCLMNQKIPAPQYLSDSLMINILGQQWPAPSMLREIPSLRLYDYGKRVARPYRKMAHAILLGPSYAIKETYRTLIQPIFENQA